MRLSIRLKAAARAAYIVFMRPELVTENVFYSVGKILDFINKVAEERHPMMTHFGLINVKTNEKYEIVSLWACASSAGDPTKRIAELIEENESLKYEISQQSAVERHLATNPQHSFPPPEGNGKA